MNTKLTIRAALLMGMAMSVHSNSYADIAGEGIRDPKLKAAYQKYERLSAFGGRNGNDRKPGLDSKRIEALKDRDPERYAILKEWKALEEKDPENYKATDEFKAVKARLDALNASRGIGIKKSSSAGAERTVATAFKGICGLELGSEMDVSKLKYDGWYKVFVGKVNPPKQFDKFTSCTVYVTAKTHRLYKIVSETEDESIVKDPRFKFDFPEQPDPEFVKAVCAKYKVSSERSSNSGFVAMMGCPFQWQMHFGDERVMVVCRNSSVGYMGNTAAVVAIDEYIEKEAKEEGVAYEGELENESRKAGAAAAAKDSDAF